MKTPIEKTVTVPLTPQSAFELFTENMDTWWPGDSHSVAAHQNRSLKKITFPKSVGEDIVEEDEAGETHIWGSIIAYDPGKYLAFHWHPGRPADQATVVTLTFTATADGTRCDLTHGGFDILGPLADAVSTSYLTGWDMVLGCYSRAAAPVVAFA